MEISLFTTEQQVYHRNCVRFTDYVYKFITILYMHILHTKSEPSMLQYRIRYSRVVLPMDAITLPHWTVSNVCQSVWKHWFNYCAFLTLFLLLSHFLQTFKCSLKYHYFLQIINGFFFTVFFFYYYYFVCLFQHYIFERINGFRNFWTIQKKIVIQIEVLALIVSAVFSYIYNFNKYYYNSLNLLKLKMNIEFL